jgi:hypothetical protein
MNENISFLVENEPEGSGGGACRVRRSQGYERAGVTAQHPHRSRRMPSDSEDGSIDIG